MCECIKEANEALEEHNCYIETKMTINRGGNKTGWAMLLPLKKIKSSKKPLPYIKAKHCPLCGDKLDG